MDNSLTLEPTKRDRRMKIPRVTNIPLLVAARSTSTIKAKKKYLAKGFFIRTTQAADTSIKTLAICNA
jgi:hypothetical protein